MAKDFEDLSFHDRPDLTPYLIHLTKNTVKDDGFMAFDNLVNILETGEIWGSGRTGYIKESQKASCFMDIPFQSLKYILNEENSNLNNPRYEPYGIAFTKKFAYKQGCRPVLYLSDSEIKLLNIPKNELWRVVKLEVTSNGWISWLHEREWRKKDSFHLPNNPIVIVKTLQEVSKLQQMIINSPNDFKVKPRAILPLKIICQGLYI